MKHLLSIEEMSAEQLIDLIDLAADLKVKRQSNAGTYQPLANQCWGLIFTKSSTRTRVSFEIGVRELGGAVIPEETVRARLWDDVTATLGETNPFDYSERSTGRFREALALGPRDQSRAEVAEVFRNLGRRLVVVRRRREQRELSAPPQRWRGREGASRSQDCEQREAAHF